MPQIFKNGSNFHPYKLKRIGNSFVRCPLFKASEVLVRIQTLHTSLFYGKIAPAATNCTSVIPSESEGSILISNGVDPVRNGELISRNERITRFSVFWDMKHSRTFLISNGVDPVRDAGCSKDGYTPNIITYVC